MAAATEDNVNASQVTGSGCIICSSVRNKYKCPRCSARYCSLECYKAHNTQCEELQKKNREKSGGDTGPKENQQAAPPPTRDDEDDEEDIYDDTKIRLKQEHYDKLKEDKSVRAALRDPRLQEIIISIDTAEDRVDALQRARKANPHLREFIDKMLDCLGMIEWDSNGHAFFQSPRKS
eukprot:gb/GECG01008705.1/.p1 GENE.gb/GECG01008705.1/~~gb/GECG01008705.1/.p1  ORF type:complete len:178 (+),score=36.62 gb/GECG01008705.1/:1-534(+)